MELLNEKSRAIAKAAYLEEKGKRADSASSTKRNERMVKYLESELEEIKKMLAEDPAASICRFHVLSNISGTGFIRAKTCPGDGRGLVFLFVAWQELVIAMRDICAHVRDSAQASSVFSSMYFSLLTPEEKKKIEEGTAERDEMSVAYIRELDESVKKLAGAMFDEFSDHQVDVFNSLRFDVAELAEKLGLSVRLATDEESAASNGYSSAPSQKAGDVLGAFRELGDLVLKARKEKAEQAKEQS